MVRRAFQGQNVEDLLFTTSPAGAAGRGSNIEANQLIGERISQMKAERDQREKNEATAAFAENLPAILDGSAPQLESILLRSIAESGGMEQAIQFTVALDKYRGEKEKRQAELFKIGGELGLKKRQIEVQRSKEAVSEQNRRGITGARTVKSSDVFPAPESSREGAPAFTNVPNDEISLEDFVNEGGAPGLPSTTEQFNQAISKIEKQSNFFLRNFYSNFPGASVDSETGEVTVKEGQNKEAAQKTFDLIRSQIPSFGQKILLNRSQIINRKTPKKKNLSDEETAQQEADKFQKELDEAGQGFNNTSTGQTSMIPETDLETLRASGFGNIADTLISRAQPVDEDEELLNELEFQFPGRNARV